MTGISLREGLLSLSNEPLFIRQVGAPPTCLFKYQIIPRLGHSQYGYQMVGGTITLTQNTTSWQSMSIRKLFTSAADATLRRTFDIIVLVRGSQNDGAMKVSVKVENFNVAFVKP